jgi:5-methylcytosine-specific restriction protein B
MTTNDALHNETGAKPLSEIISRNAKIWQMRLGRAGKEFDEVKRDCFANNHIRIGMGHFSDSDKRDSGQIDPSMRNFRETMNIGDIVLVPSTHTFICAVGVINSDCRKDTSYSDYKIVRDVRWIVKDIKENIYDFNGKTSLTRRAVVQLSRLRTSDVQQICKRHGIDIMQDIIPATTMQNVPVAEKENSGLTEAEHSHSIDIARKMKAKCYSIVDIAETTGLTEEEVEQL